MLIDKYDYLQGQINNLHRLLVVLVITQLAVLLIVIGIVVSMRDLAQ